MQARRRARELALQFLYQIDIRGSEAMSGLEEFFFFAPDVPSDMDIVEYASLLIAGCVEKKEELDSHIRKCSDNWDISRMATIDRNVLRIGVYEMIILDNVPYRVAMDEAIEIARMYGNVDSPSFVNGVLDAVYKEKANT